MRSMSDLEKTHDLVPTPASLRALTAPEFHQLAQVPPAAVKRFAFVWLFALLGFSAATIAQTDKTEELRRKLADPKTYDLDPAEWYQAIDANGDDKSQIAREYFVNKKHHTQGNLLVVWVYVETLFYSSPAKLEKQHWRIACADETAAIDETIDANGKTHVVDFPRMMALPPDSMAKFVADEACTGHPPPS